MFGLLVYAICKYIISLYSENLNSVLINLSVPICITISLIISNFISKHFICNVKKIKKEEVNYLLSTLTILPKGLMLMQLIITSLYYKTIIDFNKGVFDGGILLLSSIIYLIGYRIYKVSLKKKLLDSIKWEGLKYD